MSSTDVKITHLFHSGFMVEIKDKLLVFDYFDYTRHFNLDSTGILSPNFFKDKENIFIFVTHSHGDHFDSVIFD